MVHAYEVQTVEAFGIPYTEYHYQPDTETETALFASGEFDGGIGIEPSHPDNSNYWEGWCTGARERYLQKQKMSESEF
jgi:hypothetical protein